METERQWHNRRQRVSVLFFAHCPQDVHKSGGKQFLDVTLPVQPIVFVSLGQTSASQAEMTLSFYCENADGTLASERPKPALCVIVFIRPQPGVHRGTGHRLCGASQSWLNCWIKSSFVTEGWDIPSGPLLGCHWPHGFGTGRALCWLADIIALVRLFFRSLENMAHVHRVIWGFDLESAVAISCFSGTWNGMFSYWLFI